MDTVIFYFSGTGNTYAIAKKLADSIGNTMVIPMIKFGEIKINEFKNIGILIPVYGTHAPKMVLDKLHSVKLIKGQRIFITATYAGSKGYAVKEVKEKIQELNSNEIQEFCVKMPGSSILEYGAFPKFLENILIYFSNQKQKKIADMIKQGTKTKAIKPNLLAVLYKNNGIRMINEYQAKGSLFYTNGNCTKCGRCQETCPTNNITYEDGTMKWGNKCAQCMGCIQWCPNQAICHPQLKEARKRYHHPEIKMMPVIHKNH